MSPRKAGKEDVAAAKRVVKDAKAAAKAADREAKAAAKRARKSKRAAIPGRQGGRYVPIEKRLKNQQRERAAVEGAAEKARRAAKDVYRLIGFDALYADGIAQVEPGLFSQTVSFGDISYQSMGDESQKSVCRQMRKLYDGLTPDVGLQLLLFNRPLTKGEMSNRRFFGRVEGPAAPYAAEYSRILNDKMAEGVSNIMRERYLTFSVSADTVEESVPKLARLRSMADGVLSGMRSGTRVLRGEERLQLIRSMTRPGRERVEFGYDDLGVTRGITAKDLVCPDTMEFKPGGSASCFTSDGVWCQVLAFRSFESNLTDRCLADMVDLPMPLAISFHVKAMNPRWSKDYVRRRLKWIDKEMSEDQMDAVSKGYDFNLIPSELKFTREEAQDVYECLKGDSQRMFRYTGLVFTYAPTREELDEQAMHLISVAQAQGIELANLDYRQREGLNSVLPLGRNHVKVGRLMLTDEIAIQSPFATLELNDFGGGYYGQNKGSRNLVMLNRKGLASRNGIISGMPGSGKSFGAKREMTNTALLYPEDDVVIIDPAGEFGLLAEAFGGRNVAFGPDSETYLNPLDLSDVSELLETTQLAYKIEAVLALSAASMAEGNEGLSDVERSIISRCVEKAYLTCGKSGAVPQLQDLYDILRQQPEPEAEIVALRFERYVSGALSIFNHQSNVAFDRRITCVGLKDLPDNMRAFGIIAVLEAVRNLMYANFERGVTTWLYIDEVQSLFGHPATISYFSRFWAEGRKFNLICTGITQNCTYLLSHKDGRNLILNSDFLMLHRQSFADKAKWSELLNLSEQEEGYIDESVNPGDGLLIAVFAPCFSEARFYVEEVLVPMGFRFVDCARGFDTQGGDVRAYFKGLQTEMSDALALHAERDRLASGGLIRRNVPFGYVFDEDAPCGVRVDGEVAAFVPRIFELAAQGRWWRSKLEGQVRELRCPGPRQRANELYGHNRHAMEGWDYAAIRSMVTNPFYTGDFAPERLASIRMRKSGIPIGSFPVIEGHHPALVGRELFEEANKGLSRNRYACPTEAEGRRPCRG